MEKKYVYLVWRGDDWCDRKFVAVFSTKEDAIKEVEEQNKGSRELFFWEEEELL